MSLKSVDMQIAVHRSHTMGEKQQQLTQKPIQDQSLMANQNEKKADRDRNRSTQVSKTSDPKIRDEQEESSKQQQENDKQKKEGRTEQRVETVEIQHPYKGKHIDLSL